MRTAPQNMVVLASAGVIGSVLLLGCPKQEATTSTTSTTAAPPATLERASNIPPLHPNNIVSIAMGSKDHTTLVTAIKAADYVTSVAASGPLTVFRGAVLIVPPSHLERWWPANIASTCCYVSENV